VNGYYRGIKRYLCLVLIAHLLLTHPSTTAQGAQAEPEDTKPLNLPSVPQLQNTLRDKLWDDNINSMEQGPRNRRVGRQLKQLILLKP
jgi:hypothetical protein